MTVLAADPVEGAPAPVPDHAVRWLWTASLAVAGAGALHVAAAADHLAAGDLVVPFFLLTALAQLGFGAWLFVGSRSGKRPGVWWLAGALAGTVLLVALYLVANTTDLFAGALAHDAGTGGPVAGGAHGTSAGASRPTDGPVALDARPTAGAEAPGLLGTATVALELLAIAAMTALLPRAWRSRAVNGLLALGALTWVLWLSGVLA